MRKKTGYYIYEDRYSKEIGRYPGVYKKIDNQIEVLSKYFEMHEVQLKSKKNKLLKRLPFGSFIYCWDEAIEEVNEVDFLYIRKPLIDSGFRKFIGVLKKKNQALIVLLEIPTYPYDEEQFGGSIAAKPFYIKELQNRKNMNTIVDRIVTYSDDDEIFGIPTIKIQNGLDVSKIPVAIPRENGGYSISDSSGLPTIISRV